MNNKFSKIDFHVHVLTDTYKDFLKKQGNDYPDGFPTPEWSSEDHLELMKQCDITYSLLSISSPGMNTGNDEEAQLLIRQSNIELSQIAVKHPDQFGFFASLPLPNIAYSLAEIDYCYDILKANGFGVTTHDCGVYLGDPILDPVMEKLNTRKAVMKIHPTTPSSIPENVCENLPSPALEFFFDTTRTITNMVLNDTFKRYPKIKWIVPHAGAFLPILSDRFRGISPYIKGLKEGQVLNMDEDLNNLYYDLAGLSEYKQLEILLKVTPAEHLLYGSDYPYTIASTCKSLAEQIENTDKLTDEEKSGVFSKNFKNLFN